MSTSNSYAGLGLGIASAREKYSRAQTIPCTSRANRFQSIIVGREELGGILHLPSKLVIRLVFPVNKSLSSAFSVEKLCHWRRRRARSDLARQRPHSRMPCHWASRLRRPGARS